MERYGVIMAGGSGTRFWPLSRKSLPKQFLNLTGKDSMVNETIDRLSPVIAAERVFVVTNAAHAELTYRMTAGRLSRDHILAEPAARNTAACIGYAAMEIVRKYGDGVMGIFSSDAYIRDGERFREILESAALAAEDGDRLVTIGIRPDYPATGYGYIRRRAGETGRNGEAPVLEFVEKPDAETAEQYLRSGEYLWNSGIFLWKASVILKQFEALLPDVYDCLRTIGDSMGGARERETIEAVYPRIPKISIDYGIMERARDVFVLEGDFGWNDVGSLDAIGTLHTPDADGNVICGRQIGLDVKNCIAYSDKRLIAMVGVENLIVVETPDTVLVCDKSRAQDVKKLVERLEDEGQDDYL